MAEAEITGRELDALVAERVMGWQFVRMLVLGNKVLLQSPERITSILPEYIVEASRELYSEDHITIACPRYSTNIAAAMEVVDRLRAQFPVTLWCDTDHFVVQVFESNEGHAQDMANVSAKTLPEAICRAALAAIDSEKQAGGE